MPTLSLELQTFLLFFRYKYNGIFSIFVLIWRLWSFVYNIYFVLAKKKKQNHYSGLPILTSYLYVQMKCMQHYSIQTSGIFLPESFRSPITFLARSSCRILN